MKIDSLLSASAIALAMSAPIAARAQTAPQAEQGDGKAQDGVKDIIVTAQRTASSIQKTPISIQAYSGADLTKRGVVDIAGLAQTDSSVNINLSTGMPIIAIRGVSSQNATEVGDPAVSVATDGVFTNRPYGTFGGLYDVERVEILRGPQGTLFGRNSTGGTINVITARPTDTNEARVTAETGNYGLIASDGFANVVVADGLDARVSYDVRSRKGFRYNGPNIPNGDDEDLKSGRFQLAYKPGGAFSAWVLGEYTQQGGVGNVAQIVPFSYQPGSTTEPIHTMPAHGDGSAYPEALPTTRDLRHWELRGGMSYVLDNGISINYLGGFDKINYLRTQAVNPYYGGVGNGPLPVPLVYANREQPETINQELRIASNPQSAFTWQAGAYFFQERSSVLATTTYNPQSNIAAQGIEFDYPRLMSVSRALFAQGSYAITDKLKATLGGRYTWDQKSRAGTFYIYPAQTGLPFNLVVPQGASSKSSKPIWTAGLDYQATPANMIYAKVSTGYKVGGFNDATSTYGPETVTSYEIGTKNSFFDHHLLLNLSGFRMDYTNQQVTQFVSGVASSGSMTVNAGKSRIWGAELNATAQSAQMGKFTLSANYTHARYLQFTQSAGWDATINQNLAGNRLPLSPTWSLSGQYEYPLALGNGATLTPHANIKYQSAQYFSATNFADQRQCAYALVDAGLDYAPKSGKWMIQAYVKNLFNRTILSQADEFYTFNNYYFAYQPPRTYGVRATMNFR